MPPPSGNNAAHSGFQTQRTHNQKSKNMGISGPTKKSICPPNIYKKRNITNSFCIIIFPTSSGMTATIFAKQHLHQLEANNITSSFYQKWLEYKRRYRIRKQYHKTQQENKDVISKIKAGRYCDVTIDNRNLSKIVFNILTQI